MSQESLFKEKKIPIESYLILKEFNFLIENFKEINPYIFRFERYDDRVTHKLKEFKILCEQREQLLQKYKRLKKSLALIASQLDKIKKSACDKKNYFKVREKKLRSLKIIIQMTENFLIIIKKKEELDDLFHDIKENPFYSFMKCEEQEWLEGVMHKNPDEYEIIEINKRVSDILRKTLLFKESFFNQHLSIDESKKEMRLLNNAIDNYKKISNSLSEESINDLSFYVKIILLNTNLKYIFFEIEKNNIESKMPLEYFKEKNKNIKSLKKMYTFKKQFIIKTTDEENRENLIKLFRIFVKWIRNFIVSFFKKIAGGNKKNTKTLRKKKGTIK